MGDQAYCVGGNSPPGGVGTTTVNMYDLSDNAFTGKTAMSYRRNWYFNTYGSGASAEVDGYAFGSYGLGTPDAKSTEKYSIAGNSWSIKTSQPFNNGHGSAPLLAGAIYTGQQKYNIANDAWKGYTNPGELFRVFEVGGYIYLVLNSSTTEAYKYNPDTDSLSAITANSVAQNAPGTFGDGTYGYLCGNYDGGSNTQRYDPVGNSWAARAAMGFNGGMNGTFVISGQGHSVGGTPGGSGNSWHGRYDNSGNSWTAKTAYPNAWAGICGFAVPANLPPNAPTGLSVSNT